MAQSYEHVFTPITVKGIDFKNRIETPPTLPFLASADGMATAELVAYHRAFARGGAGIVTVGDSGISLRGKNHEGQLNLGTDAAIPGLNKLYEAISRYGAVASIELNHGGHNTFVKGQRPLGASRLPSGLEEQAAALEGRFPVTPVEMTEDDIAETIESFANAAWRCRAANFKMIMLHGAHGHILAQFLSPLWNNRTDRWGGSVEKRARFPLAVLDAVRKKCGPDLIIEYRISLDEKAPGGLGPDDVIEFLKMIEDKIDIVHVSAGLLSIPTLSHHMIQPLYMPHMYNVHYAEMAKKRTNLLVTTVGSILTLENAEKILADGRADFVALGRPFIADAELMRKSLSGRQEDVRPCIRCNWCAGRPRHTFLPTRCSVNPFAARGVEYPTENSIAKADKKKRILIAGGGPAGMQAALTGMKRGHEVFLYEMTDGLGGMLDTGSKLPFKGDLRKFLDWLISQTLECGATIKYGTEVTAAIVDGIKPDALVIAVGAVPFIPNVPGVERPNVHWAGDVDAGRAEVGKEVVVIGAGITGGETALALARQGKTVTILEMLGPESLGNGGSPIAVTGLFELLKESGVTIVPHTKMQAITDSGVRTINNSFREMEYPAESIVLATGMRARKEKVAELRRLIPETEVYVIGDCLRPRTLAAATHEGFNAVVDI
jgi:2,4-dienoyl-CoA reductase-like NADH-dependent reductase (Old Yellow Enzyme family)/thioredoxin reductase